DFAAKCARNDVNHHVAPLRQSSHQISPSLAAKLPPALRRPRGSPCRTVGPAPPARRGRPKASRLQAGADVAQRNLPQRKIAATSGRVAGGSLFDRCTGKARWLGLSLSWPARPPHISPERSWVYVTYYDFRRTTSDGQTAASGRRISQLRQSIV